MPKSITDYYIVTGNLQMGELSIEIAEDLSLGAFCDGCWKLDAWVDEGHIPRPKPYIWE